MSAAEELRDWAASGAMALTGRPDGPPLAVLGSPATAVRRALESLQRLHPEADLPGVHLLGERAAIARLSRQGPRSCGQAFQAVPTRDGWFGLSLPRESDLELVPALVSSEVVDDPWTAVSTWASATTTAEAVERAALLGLACCGVPDSLPQREGVVITPGGRRRPTRDRPRVLDLTALWAGPLCAHLLSLCGFEVTKVESVRRPDGARRGAPAFFDLLNGGHRMVALDLPSPSAVEELRGLIEATDLVLESSRARVLRQWGIDAEEVVKAGISWVSITAYGRGVQRVGFGDDVAVGAGLGRLDGGELLPPGDALADPLAGVAAAAAAAELFAGDRAALVDVSMHHVAASTAGPLETHSVRLEDGAWVVDSESGTFPVLLPRARTPRSAAGALGADNAEVLA